MECHLTLALGRIRNFSEIATKFRTHSTRAHSFGPFYTKKHEISRTFALKKCELLRWSSFGLFGQKLALFSAARAISRF
jgi:hypothetical protein